MSPMKGTRCWVSGGLWGFGVTSFCEGVTTISVTCGSHVIAYAGVVRHAFLCRMFLDVSISLGCLARLKAVHIVATEMGIECSRCCRHPPPPPFTSVVELTGWRGPSQPEILIRRPGREGSSNLCDLSGLSFWFMSALRNIRETINASPPPPPQGVGYQARKFSYLL